MIESGEHSVIPTIVSRAKAILGRRRSSEKEKILRLADLSMDEETHEAWRAGKPLKDLRIIHRL